MAFQVPTILVPVAGGGEAISSVLATHPQFAHCMGGLDQLDVVEFLRFLVVHASFRDVPFSPSLPVDAVWHRTLPYTSLYRHLCSFAGVLDGVVEHNPARADDAYDVKRQRYENMLAAYAQVFRFPPPEYSWPRGYLAPAPVAAPVHKIPPPAPALPAEKSAVHAPASSAPSIAADDTIMVNIRCVNGDISSYKMRWTTPFRGLFIVFERRYNIQRGTYRYMHNGERLKDHETPLSRWVESGDTIDAQKEETGC